MRNFFWVSSSAESLAEIHSIYANDFLYGRFISISASKLAGKSAGKEKERVLQQFAGKKESEQRDTIVSVTIRRSIIYSRKKGLIRWAPSTIDLWWVSRRNKRILVEWKSLSMISPVLGGHRRSIPAVAKAWEAALLGGAVRRETASLARRRKRALHLKAFKRKWNNFQHTFLYGLTVNLNNASDIRWQPHVIQNEKKNAREKAKLWLQA